MYRRRRRRRRFPFQRIQARIYIIYVIYLTPYVCGARLSGRRQTGSRWKREKPLIRFLFSPSRPQNNSFSRHSRHGELHGQLPVAFDERWIIGLAKIVCRTTEWLGRSRTVPANTPQTVWRKVKSLKSFCITRPNPTEVVNGLFGGHTPFEAWSQWWWGEDSQVSRESYRRNRTTSLGSFLIILENEKK